MSIRNTFFALILVVVAGFFTLTHQENSRACRAAGYDGALYSLTSLGVECIKNDNGDVLIVPLKQLQK